MLDCAQQDDYCPREVVVHVASYHLDRSKQHNELNHGLGLRLPLARRLFAAAGFFENSLYRTSVYAGVGTDVRLLDHVALRLTAAVLTGYQVPVLPVILPELVISGRRYGMAIGFMPKLKFDAGEVDAVVTLSLLKRF